MYRVQKDAKDVIDLPRLRHIPLMDSDKALEVVLACKQFCKQAQIGKKVREPAMYVGINEVSRAVEKGVSIRLIVLSNVEENIIVQHVLQLATMSVIPLMKLPLSRFELGKHFGLHSITVFAIPDLPQFAPLVSQLPPLDTFLHSDFLHEIGSELAPQRKRRKIEAP